MSGDKAIFLDRDGVVVEDTGYVYKTEHFKLLPNAIKGMKLLRNYKLFIVTNQSGIGRGFYTLSDFQKFNNHLLEQLKKHNVKIEKIYYCPHKPQDNCKCRKPKIKLLKDAEKEFKINLKSSFVIGDKKSDIELGNNAGCKTILVLTGDGINANAKDEISDYIAKDLLDAAKWILRNKEFEKINFPLEN